MAKSNKDSKKKGASVEGEGVKARKAIAKARKAGSTTEDIAKAAMRDDSTIRAIESGVIKNTPKGLSAKISKAKKSSKTATKKSKASKKKAAASRKKHN